MIRLLVFAILAAAIYLALRSFFAGPPGERRAQDTLEMVKDPNCDTYIPKSQAIQKTLAGTTYYFCGKKCADEFTAHKSGRP